MHKSRLLSDNGSGYASGDLAEWLQGKGMKHSCGAPYHPQTQGQTDRWHLTLKNRIQLENHFLPGAPEERIKAFVNHYNHQRYHGSLGNVTPADVYFGRDKAILEQRERFKQKTPETRRLHHSQRDAPSNQPDEPVSLLVQTTSGPKNSDDVHPAGADKMASQKTDRSACKQRSK